MSSNSEGKAYEHVVREVLGIHPNSSMGRMLTRSGIKSVDRLLNLKEDFLKQVTVTGSDGQQHHMPSFQWTNVLNLRRYCEYNQQQGTPIRDWLQVKANDLLTYVEDYGPYVIRETVTMPSPPGKQLYPKYTPATYCSPHGRTAYSGSIYDNLEKSPLNLRLKLFAQGIYPHGTPSTQSSVASTITKNASDEVAPDADDDNQSSKLTKG